MSRCCLLSCGTGNNLVVYCFCSLLVAVLAGTITGLRVLLNLPVRGWDRVCGALGEEEMPQPQLIGAQVPVDW